MRTSEKLILLQSAFSPYRLPNLAASYSLSGAASDNTYLLNAGNVQLIADQSINSRVNGLVLNGVAGNYASASDSAAISITGDIDLRVKMSPTNVTPPIYWSLLAKSYSGNTHLSYVLLYTTTGAIQLIWCPTANVVDAISVTSSALVPVVAYGTIWVRATLDVDNGAGGYDCKFWTSTDGVAWTQLGTTTTGGSTTSIYDSADDLQIGRTGDNARYFTGNIYRAQIYNGIAGTLAFDANFSTAAKLAASFTESSANAATVTINTSGDLGARICGARDLVQLTAAKQPAFSVVGGYNTATFDGVNDYMKAAAFPLSQPESVYFVGSQVTWAGFDTVLDGDAAGSQSFEQTGSTPIIGLRGGGGIQAGNGGLAIATKGVLRGVFNGASSSLGVNLGAAATGTTSGLMGAFTLGSQGDGTDNGNITFNEALLRAAADDATLQGQIAGVLIKKWGISLP